MYSNALKEIQEEVLPKTFRLDLSINDERVHKCIADRCDAPAISAELVIPADIQELSVYKRFADIDKKNDFRQKLLDTLKNDWNNQYGADQAEKLITSFGYLVEELDKSGALIFASILNSEKFRKLVNSYNCILESLGSKSWIHTYVNLGNHPDFLTDKEFSKAFLHPLLLALVSHRVGGPIRIVDARGKDAEPVSVLAQDNMLHIDNTPFCDEYKVLLTWEKNKISGPRGQNFVFLPGTHKGSRNCFTDEERGVWSTENASIFVTKTAIESLFKLQKEVLCADKPFFVEVTHVEKPLTTVFAAGSLVHHRFRTAEGFSRSCVIIAFHRAEDNPGQLLATEHLSSLADYARLNQCLFGCQCADVEREFLAALKEKSDEIRLLLVKLGDHEDLQEVIGPKGRKLSDAKVEEWINNSTEAPTIETLKVKAGFLATQKELSEDKFASFVKKMMSFDKHGPLISFCTVMGMRRFASGHEIKSER